MFLSTPLKWSYYLMLLAGLIIPSDGGQGFFNLKSLSFLSTSCLGIAHLTIKQSLKKTQFHFIAVSFGVLSALLIWWMIGVIRTDQIIEGSTAQFKLFIITLFVPVMSLYLLSEKIITAQNFFKVVIYGNCLYCTLKMGLVVLHLLHVINMWDMLDALGMRFMKMEIIGNIGRLQTSVDIITPFSVFFALQSTRFGLNLKPSFRMYYCVVALFANFLSFSRFLIFIYCLSFVLYLLTGSFSKIIKGALGCLICGIIAVTAIGVENSAKIVEKRLFSKDNFLSDYTRKKQLTALMKEFFLCPLLGKGLGGYTKECIRDEKLKYSYEVQWAAFLMQFGIVGVCGLMSLISLIIWELIKPAYTRVKIASLILLFFWLFSGFTNPFLISLTSGIAYTLFLLVDKALIKVSTQPTFTKHLALN